MIGLFLIGLVLLLFAIGYIILYLIKKVKGRNSLLSKKILYFPLIVGLLLIILSISFFDTGIQGQLEEAEEKNIELESEAKELRTMATELGDKVEVLESEKETLTTQLSEAETKLSDAESQTKEYEDNKTKYEEKMATLASEKESLEKQISKLEEEVASAQAQSSSSSTTSNSTNSNSASTVSSGNNDFANCTELRSVYPNGVASSHPAYTSKMDRDKDGYACER